MNFSSPPAIPKSPGMTIPHFLKEANVVVHEVKSLTTGQLKGVLGDPSSAIASAATKAFDKWDFDIKPRSDEKGEWNEEASHLVPAVHAFDGFAFKKLDGRSLSDEGFNYCSNHLRILDPIYGVLKGSDGVQEYRMELDNKALDVDEKTLKEFWKGLVTGRFVEEFEGQEAGVILDAASTEYSSLLDRVRLEAANIRLYEIKFAGPGGKNPPSATLKHLRGLFTRWCADNNVVDLVGAKGFDLEGYEFDRVDEGKKGASLSFKKRGEGGKEPAKKKQKKN